MSSLLCFYIVAIVKFRLCSNNDSCNIVLISGAPFNHQNANKLFSLKVLNSICLIHFHTQSKSFYCRIMLGYSSLSKIYMLEYIHWRRSALNSAGALQGKGGEFRGIFTPFYTINFRGLCKSGGARAPPAAPPSSAPMLIIYYMYRI